MAIQSTDIGLALAEDVGDVSQLQTINKKVVLAINEVLAASGNAQTQLYVAGEDNVVIGTGNVVHGNNNMIIGNGNVVAGDNFIVIGNTKRALNPNAFIPESIDTYEKHVFLTIADGATPPSIGDMVCLSICSTFYDNNYEESWWGDTGLYVTKVISTDFAESNYIELESLPILEAPEGYPVFDGSSLGFFALLTDASKISADNGLSMGTATTGKSAVTMNNGRASGENAMGVNSALAEGINAFACNYGKGNGYYTFAANYALAVGSYSAAFGEGCSYGHNSAAFNASYTAGRGIKCVSLNVADDTVTAASGEDVSALVDSYILLRWTFSVGNTASMFLYTKVISVSGQTLTLEADLSAVYPNMVLMSDGYIYRVEYYNSNNVALGKSVAGGDYAMTCGNGTVCVHEGAMLCGKFGVSPESYSWALANGMNHNNKGLAAKILQNGNVSADGTFSSPCADYAEMFQWSDDNPDNEDRAGYFVTLDGDKIKKAGLFEPLVLGVVSGNPAILGDSSELHWNGKYMTDDFGRVLYHDVIIPTETQEREVFGTNGQLEKKTVIIKEEHMERQPVLNPDYNSNLEYIPRLNRKEWSAVGVLGKLVVYDDGTCEVGGLCQSNADGRATKALTSGYPVLKRIATDKILIWLKG